MYIDPNSKKQKFLRCLSHINSMNDEIYQKHMSDMQQLDNLIELLDNNHTINNVIEENINLGYSFQVVCPSCVSSNDFKYRIFDFFQKNFFRSNYKYYGYFYDDLDNVCCFSFAMYRLIGKKKEYLKVNDNIFTALDNYIKEKKLVF